MPAAALLLALAPVPAPAQEARPNVARLAFYAKPQGFDPMGGGSAVDSILQRQVYESLLEFDVAAAPRYDALRGALAERWEGSEDGRLWVFVLKPQARFYDPFDPPLWPSRTRPVTAYDVVYSWLRQADGRTGASQGWVFGDLIAGLAEFHDRTAASAEAGAAAWREVEAAGGLPDLRALDERCLMVRLSRPAPAFLMQCASAGAAVVPREAVARSGEQFLNQPVGSGAFYLADWIPGSQATFKRVPDWRAEPSPYGDGRLPFLDELRVQIVADSSVRTQLFAAQELDVLPVLADAYARFLEHGQPNAELRARGVTAHTLPPTSSSMLTFNLDDPVIGIIPGDTEGNARRLKLRQALALALPYERYRQQIRNDSWAEPGRSFLPAYLDPDQSLPAFPYGVAAGDEDTRLRQARALLAEAGYPEGRGLPALSLDLAPPDRLVRITGELFADAWSHLGVRCEQNVRGWNELMQSTVDGRFQMFPRTWTMENADPGTLLCIYYHGSGPAVNRCRMADPEFDAAYETLQRSTDPAVRRRQVQAMVERLNATVPVAPLDFPGGVVLVQPWLVNVNFHPFDPYPCKLYRVVAP